MRLATWTKRSSFIFVNYHVSNEFQCSYCGEIMEEDPDELPKADSRLMLAKFNDQMEPLLKEVEDIKIPADLLEPDPIEVNGSTIKLVKGSKIEKDGEAVEEVVKKEQPPWSAEVSVYPSTLQCPYYYCILLYQRAD
uniref:Uncharacterized protein n=1 Tax=Tetranychus urticae TaxID=32264 RepID=T1JQE6_TETUR